MPLTLLPASAQAFAPRSAPTVVLGSRVEHWMTQTLKRINKVKRPLNNVKQHHACILETLSGSDAIWSLASIMVPNAPDSDLKRDKNLLSEAASNYQLITVEAYVVHVDMVSQNEVAFKLTPETIERLIGYHKNIYSVDVSASTWTWSEKDAQLKKLQDDFVQAVNRYVFRASIRALEGLEEDGAGELLEGRSGQVKSDIMGLFLPLLPPPPKIVDVVYPPNAFAHSGYALGGPWWPAMTSTGHHFAPPPPPPEQFRILGSSPSPSTSPEETMAPVWGNSAFNETNLGSPTPSLSMPSSSPTTYFTPSPIATAPMPVLQLPSALASQCGSSAGFGGFGQQSPWMYTDFMMSGLQQVPIS